MKEEIFKGFMFKGRPDPNYSKVTDQVKFIPFNYCPYCKVRILPTSKTCKKHRLIDPEARKKHSEGIKKGYKERREFYNQTKK